MQKKDAMASSEVSGVASRNRHTVEREKTTLYVCENECAFKQIIRRSESRWTGGSLKRQARLTVWPLFMRGSGDSPTGDREVPAKRSLMENYAASGCVLPGAFGTFVLGD